MSKKHQYTLRFSHTDRDLSVDDGMPLDRLNQVLAGIIEVTKRHASPIVLKEIRNGSYAITLQSESHEPFDVLKVVHSKFSDARLYNLLPEERKYYKVLKAITDEGYSLKADNDKGKQAIQLNQGMPELPSDKIIHESIEVSGVVTEMGGVSLDGKRHILLEGYRNRIAITEEQDKSLSSSYRSKITAFLKVSYLLSNPDKIEHIELIDFENIPSSTWVERAEAFRDEHPETFKDLGDAAESIRKLRGPDNEAN